MPVARQIDSPLTMIVNNGALIRSKEGADTSAASPAARYFAACAAAHEGPGAMAPPWFSTGHAKNQVMLEVLDQDDSMRYAYYSRNMEFIGLANPLENLPDGGSDPGDVSPERSRRWREGGSGSARGLFSRESMDSR